MLTHVFPRNSLLLGVLVGLLEDFAVGVPAILPTKLKLATLVESFGLKWTELVDFGFTVVAEEDLVMTGRTIVGPPTEIEYR